MLKSLKNPKKLKYNNTKQPNYQYLEVNRVNYKNILYKFEFNLNTIKTTLQTKKRKFFLQILI